MCSQRVLESARRFWEVGVAPVDCKILLLKDHEILLLVFMASLTEPSPVLLGLYTLSTSASLEPSTEDPESSTGGYSALWRRWLTDPASHTLAGHSVRQGYLPAPAVSLSAINAEAV